MNNIPLMIAFALFVGVVCQILSRFAQVPGIVLFLIAGATLGTDGFDLIDGNKFGPHLSDLIGMAVAVILFEGGMLLRVDAIRRNALVIRRLVTSGALLTAFGGTLAARWIMDWSWTLSTLFGTLVIVTGPTVVKPLLTRIGVKRNLQTILQAEGVLIDPIGALIAIIVLEVIISGTPTGAALGFANLGIHLLFGVIAGTLSGMILVWVLRRRTVVPDEYANILTLSSALVLFQVSNAVFHESGIMAVTVAGVFIGNAHLPTRHKIHEFKEQLTLLLIGLLFIILTASIRLDDIKSLGWRGVFTVAAVMLIVRPIVIIWSSRGTNLTWPEKIFMSWLAPRGIVAAAVASLFATQLSLHGHSGGQQLQAMVFMVIAGTVVIQGLTAGYFAELLGVRRPRNNGYAIIGSHHLARTLAHKLMESDQDVVVIDRNVQTNREAEGEGIRVIHGNPVEGSVLKRALVDTRRGVIGLSDNMGMNMEALRTVFHLSKSPRLYLAQKAKDVSEDALRSIQATELFGLTVDVTYWSQMLDRQQVDIITFVRQGPSTGESSKAYQSIAKIWNGKSHAVLPLTVCKNGQNEPYSTVEDLEACSEFTLLIHSLAAPEILHEAQSESQWSKQIHEQL